MLLAVEKQKQSLHKMPKHTDVKDKLIHFLNERRSHVSADYVFVSFYQSNTIGPTGFAKNILFKDQAVPAFLGPARTPQTTVPLNMNLTNGAHNKMLITINGEVKPNAKQIIVVLSKGKDIAFSFNPRFNEGGKQVIVRNSLIGKRWGQEERESPSFPFVPGKPFELKILCTDTEFKVAVNKSHLLEYKHRIRELNQIKGLGVYNDVTLKSVNVETLK